MGKIMDHASDGLLSDVKYSAQEFARAAQRVRMQLEEDYPEHDKYGLLLAGKLSDKILDTVESDFFDGVLWDILELVGKQLHSTADTQYSGRSICEFILDLLKTGTEDRSILRKGTDRPKRRII